MNISVKVYNLSLKGSRRVTVVKGDFLIVQQKNS